MKEQFHRPKHPHAQGPKSSSQWYKQHRLSGCGHGRLRLSIQEPNHGSIFPVGPGTGGCPQKTLPGEGGTLTPYTYNHTRGGELDAQWLPLLHSKGTGLALDSPRPRPQEGLSGKTQGAGLRTTTPQEPVLRPRAGGPGLRAECWRQSPNPQTETLVYPTRGWAAFFPELPRVLPLEKSPALCPWSRGQCGIHCDPLSFQ